MSDFVKLENAVNGLCLRKNGWPLKKGAKSTESIMATVTEYTGKKYKSNSIAEAIKDGKAILDAHKKVLCTNSSGVSSE